jgi:hypothetical protein
MRDAVYTYNLHVVSGTYRLHSREGFKGTRRGTGRKDEPVAVLFLCPVLNPLVRFHINATTMLQDA